jgi:hypothetical protein
MMPRLINDQKPSIVLVWIARGTAMDELVLVLLSPRGMATAHRVLTQNYAWFTHASHVRNFDLIREKGLLPANPGAEPPVEVIQSIASGGHIICLQVVPKLNYLPVPGPAFKLALPREVLPTRIGVDWSFGDWRQYLHTIQKNHMELDRIVLEHVRTLESFVSYNQIPAHALRLCPRRDPNLPPHD